MRNPIARISNALARNGVENDRNQRRIEEARYQQVLRTGEALINIRLR